MCHEEKYMTKHIQWSSPLNDSVKENNFGLCDHKNIVQPRFNTIAYGKHSVLV